MPFTSHLLDKRDVTQCCELQRNAPLNAVTSDHWTSSIFVCLLPRSIFVCRCYIKSQWCSWLFLKTGVRMTDFTYQHNFLCCQVYGCQKLNAQNFTADQFMKWLATNCPLKLHCVSLRESRHQAHSDRGTKWFSDRSQSVMATYQIEHLKSTNQKLTVGIQ